MRFGMVMAAVVLLLGGSSYRAEASPISYREWSNICSGDVVSACASVTLKTDGTLVTLQIENLSGLPGSDSYGNYLFTNISFFNRSQADIPDVVEGTATT